MTDLGVGLDGFCATGSVRLVPSAQKGNGLKIKRRRFMLHSAKAAAGL